ncbi:bromodomain-containing protein 4-like [Micropterus dolomieu]|uniref:bromodomain-containing protein 4-like n=1 Tax=Micropterus dolomieu TaxID=147949 RepID=UPI001E8ECFBF|nr:bromodomain-containing protein 4-like [Micropterus dolomieu]
MAEGQGNAGAGNQPNYSPQLGQSQESWEYWRSQNYTLGPQPQPRPPLFSNYQITLASTGFTTQSVHEERPPPPPYSWSTMEPNSALPSTSGSWPPAMPTQGGFGLQPPPGSMLRQLLTQPTPHSSGQMWTAPVPPRSQPPNPPVNWNQVAPPRRIDEPGDMASQPRHHVRGMLAQQGTHQNLFITSEGLLQLLDAQETPPPDWCALPRPLSSIQRLVVCRDGEGEDAPSQVADPYNPLVPLADLAAGQAAMGITEQQGPHASTDVRPRSTSPHTSDMSFTDGYSTDSIHQYSPTTPDPRPQAPMPLPWESPTVHSPQQPSDDDAPRDEQHNFPEEIRPLRRSARILAYSLATSTTQQTPDDSTSTTQQAPDDSTSTTQQAPDDSTPGNVSPATTDGDPDYWGKMPLQEFNQLLSEMQPAQIAARRKDRRRALGRIATRLRQQTGQLRRAPAKQHDLQLLRECCNTLQTRCEQLQTRCEQLEKRCEQLETAMYIVQMKGAAQAAQAKPSQP